MTPLDPVRLLNLEALLILPFLILMLFTQLERAGEVRRPFKTARIESFIMLGVFAILMVCFGLGLSNVSPLLGFELAAGFTLTLLHPVNGLCFFVALLFLRPWEVVESPALMIVPRALAVTSLISWIIHPWSHAKIMPRAERALFIFLGFSAWLFLSTFVTPHIAATQADWFETFFKSFVVLLMCLFFIESERSAYEFQNTILFGVFATAILGFSQYTGAGTDRLSVTALSMLDPNDLAAVSVMVVPLALALFFDKSGGVSKRVSGAFFFIISLLAIWYSQSRGALLALAIQFMGYQLLTAISKRRLMTFLTVGLIGVLYLGVRQMIHRAPEEMEMSSESRIEYWKAAGMMAIHHPLLGVGYGEFPETYESDPSFPKYEEGQHTAHSSWLLAFAESGVIGGILFAAFFVKVFKLSWRNRRDHPDQLFALAGYAVAMSFLSHTYLIFPYLLFGLILAFDSLKEPSYEAA